MAESARNTYATTSSNGAATTPNAVAVVNDGTADRQIVVLGAGDGTTGLVDGTVANPLHVTQTDLSATFSISANATSGGSITGMSGISSAIIHVTSIPSATLQVQITVDGVNWVNINGSQQVINAATGAYQASGNITASGIYQIDVAGCVGVRVITTTYTTGPVTGVVKVSNATAQVSIDGIIQDNLTQINGVTLSTSNGATGTGVPRVILTNDYLSTLVARLTTATSGGASVYTGAVTTTVTAVKTSAGQIYGWQIGNSNTSAAYVQLFNALTTGVTLGTTTPFLSIYVPPSSQIAIDHPMGVAFGTAISVACSTTRGGATAPTNALDLNFFYA